MLALFAASGAAGLVDQVAFAKYLSYIVGGTAYAVSAVLAAFMTGLALGAHLGGGVSARVRRPVLAYGALELVVAAAVAASPLAFEGLTALYAALARRAPQSLAFLSGLRFLAAFSVVVVPTAAMGATLPILVRALGEPGRPGDGAGAGKLGALYAGNTLGGAAGALLAAYALLPALGLRRTLLISSLTSAAVGLGALALGRAARAPSMRGPEADAEAPAAGARARLPERTMVALALLSGALVFASEVVFTHLLALLVGNSAYAFGLMLAVFLCCLFAGAARAGDVEARFGAGALPLGLAATALALAVTFPLWDRLPYFFANSGARVTSFAGREAVRGFVCFLVLGLPATLMGLTFPLLLRHAFGERQAGRWIGRLTAVNTAGAVAGALVAGYGLLPALGSDRSLRAVALAFAASALAAGPAVRLGRGRLTAVVAVAAVALTVVMPRWNLARLTSGANVYFQGWGDPDEIPFLREDMHGGVTTVHRTGTMLTLWTNGKFQGDLGPETWTQRSFAHYPSIFVSRFDRALVIGLGTGATLGAVAAYPWREIDVVEISPAIVEAARRFFGPGNRRALEDPRVTVHHDDGRNHLLVHDGRYDLISMELTSIWFAGAGNLYNREFYRLARDRLAPGGVLAQWIQAHHATRRDVATIIGTVRDVFPHVAVFFGGSQCVLVASAEPLVASAARLDALEAAPALRAVLPEGRHLRELTADVLVAGAGVAAFLDESARAAGLPRADLVSTDDSVYLEYATPRSNVLPWSSRAAMVAVLRAYRDPEAVQRLLGP